MISKKKMYLYIYLQKDIAIHIAKNVYFGTIKGIKMKRVLVNLELRKFAHTRSTSSGKDLKAI